MFAQRDKATVSFNKKQAKAAGPFHQSNAKTNQMRNTAQQVVPMSGNKNLIGSSYQQSPATSYAP